MSWTLKIKHTRPNAGVPFYRDTSGGGKYLSDSDRAYIKSTYVDTGKRLSFSASFSEDQLEVTRTFVFSNEAAKNEYANDTVIQKWLAIRNDHNTTHNISKVTVQNEAT